MIKVERLTLDAFNEFGYFADILAPQTASFSPKPVEFFPDIMRMYAPSNIYSMSSVKVDPRDFIVDSTEYHSNTCEATLPIDGDMIIHVGPPTHSEVPYDMIRAFFIPKGTMVVLKPGVWHGAPFVTDSFSHAALVILPERTYANDCIEVKIAPKMRLLIDFKR